MLLEAYALLQHTIGAVPDLYLAGSPPSVDALRSLRELGIENKVHLVGSMQGEELASLYRNAQLFVLSSDEEGLGIVILEAMASGLPVVSTACGGPETIVINGETGLLIPIRDAQALARAMRRLLSDPVLRKRMGAAGRQLAEEHFSLSAIGKLFLDRYNETINAG
ncbi:MAG: hypothetical protein NVS4B8_27980 [Herpetosiphon sp.]